MNLKVVQVHAPATESRDNKVEVFYEQLTNTVRGISKTDLVTIVSDLNAKVGPDAFEQWSGTVGHFGLGMTNAWAARLLEVANNLGFVLVNTLFLHKVSRLATQ